MKRTISVFLLLLTLLSPSCVTAQHRWDIVETSPLARMLLTNDTPQQWAATILLGTNYNFGNLATLNTSNNFSGINVLTNRGNLLVGDGSGVSNVSPANITAGTVPAALSFTNMGNNLTGTFTGNGAGVTNVQGSNVTGQVPIGVIPPSVALLNGTNNWAGTNTFAGALIANNSNNVIAGNLYPSNIVAGTVKAAISFTNTGNVLVGNGAGVSNIPASSITSGTMGSVNINNPGGTFSAGTITAALSTSSTIYSGLAVSGMAITSGAGMGSSGSLTLDTGTANNTGFNVTITTPSTGNAASSVVFTVFFSPFLYSTAPHVGMSSMSSTAAALSGNAQVYISSISSGNMVVSVGTTALTASTTYKWSFVLIQ